VHVVEVPDGSCNRYEYESELGVIMRGRVLQSPHERREEPGGSRTREAEGGEAGTETYP
jgi:hypothetical protein